MAQFPPKGREGRNYLVIAPQGRFVGATALFFGASVQRGNTIDLNHLFGNCFISRHDKVSGLLNTLWKNGEKLRQMARQK